MATLEPLDPLETSPELTQSSIKKGYTKIENLDDLCVNTILDILFNVDLKSYLNCISTSKTMYEFDYQHRHRWETRAKDKYPNLCGIRRSNEFILKQVKTINYAKYLCRVNCITVADNESVADLKRKLQQLDDIKFMVISITIKTSHIKYINELYVVPKPSFLSWKEHYIHIKLLKSKDKYNRYEIIAQHLFEIFSKSKYSDMIWLYKEYIQFIEQYCYIYSEIKRLINILDAIIYVLALNRYYNAIFDIFSAHYIIKAFKHVPLSMVLEYIDKMLNNIEMNAVDICDDFQSVYDNYMSNYSKYIADLENFPERFYDFDGGLQSDYLYAILKRFNKLDICTAVIFINNNQYKVVDLIVKHIKNTYVCIDIALKLITHSNSIHYKVIDYVFSRDLHIDWKFIFLKLDDSDEPDENGDDLFDKILYKAMAYNKLPSFDEWEKYTKETTSLCKKLRSTTVMRNAGLIPYQKYV